VQALGRVTAIVAATAMFLVLATAASGSGNPAAPDPDTSQMVLASTDFSASSIYLDRQVTPTAPVISEHERAFAGVRLGSQRIFEIVTIVELLPDAETTTLGFDQVRALLNTPIGRKQIAKEFASTFLRGGVKIKSISVGAPISVAAGQAAFRVPVLMKTSKGRLSLPISVFRLDRAIGVDVFASYPGHTLSASAVVSVIRRSAAHFQTAFTVKNAVVPSIGGAAQQGQTLTANPGVWNGAPSGFTYQWNRCTGGTCAAISGATGTTYLVGTADSGSTLEVTVTGANTASSSSATSVATAVVP
jgi:hypothetical protein